MGVTLWSESPAHCTWCSKEGCILDLQLLYTVLRVRIVPLLRSSYDDPDLSGRLIRTDGTVSQVPLISCSGQNEGFPLITHPNLPRSQWPLFLMFVSCPRSMWRRSLRCSKRNLRSCCRINGTYAVVTASVLFMKPENSITPAIWAAVQSQCRHCTSEHIVERTIDFALDGLVDFYAIWCLDVPDIW